MTMPFYVSPEQQMLDRAEFARKGIARGRSVAVMQVEVGIVCIAENHSSTLHKISEIYDRIGFAAVGRYHEFEMLRVAGIQHADLRGYAYDRSDVTARSLAGAYSQLLGGAFASSGDKPYEVDLILAELGETVADDVLYRISYDGVIVDEQQVSVIGGDADRIAQALREQHEVGHALDDAVRLAAGSLSTGEPLTATQLEVAVLDRQLTRRRRFRRIAVSDVEAMLNG